MNHQDVYNKVVSIIAEQLNINKDTISGDSVLESLGADSLDRFEIVMKIEEAFGIAIKDEDAENLITVSQASDYVFNLVK